MARWSYSWADQENAIKSVKLTKLVSDLKTSGGELTETVMATSRALNIKKDLYEDLRDPAYASAYINEAILDGDEVVLKTALADVIRARGVAAVARKAGINRVTVYKTLKPETESSFTTMHALLIACNVQLQVQPATRRRKRA